MNVYGEMLAALRDAGSRRGGVLRLRLGTVKTAEPLAVDVAGIPQKAAHFYITDRLLSGHKEDVVIKGNASGSLSISASCGYGSHDSMSVNSGSMTLAEGTVTQRGPVLKAGDTVLLLTDDDQTFYLMDKVVHL